MLLGNCYYCKSKRISSILSILSYNNIRYYNSIKKIIGNDKTAVKSIVLNDNYIKTSINTVYTSHLLDPTLDLDTYQSLSKQIFNYNVKYVTPKDFKYELPKHGIPEFAFVGRSNVGKSSLISTLIKNRAIVKISKEPGCTRSINFFALYKGDGVDVNTHQLYLVDLPGYGFAKAGKEEQKKWKAFIYDYLNNRDPSTLRRVYILVDSRHGMKSSDVEIMKLLDDAKICYQIILTKSDLCSEKDLKYALSSSFEEIMAKRMNTCFPYLHLVSSKNDQGIQQLQQSIAEVASHKWVKKQDSTSELNQILQNDPDLLENDPDLLEKIKANINIAMPGALDNITYENADDIAKKLNESMKK